MRFKLMHRKIDVRERRSVGLHGSLMIRLKITGRSVARNYTNACVFYSARCSSKQDSMPSPHDQ